MKIVRNLTQKVLVCSKNNELLALFRNNAPTNEYAKDNAMINPTVHIESNGSSTFTFKMNSTCEKWNYIKDPENIYVVDGRKYTALNENSYSFLGDEVTVSLVETWYLLSKRFVQAYNVPKDEEFIDDQSVVLLPKSTEPLMVNGKRYDNVPYPRGSAGYNLWALLQDSGWKLGICDVMVDGFSPAEDYGVFNLETDMKDLLYNIRQVQNLYGGILEWDSMNNIVNLRDPDKWDTDNGFTIMKGKNLKSIEFIQNNDIVTRLFPLGETNLNIAEVNNGKRYIENFSYTNQVFEANITNSDIYDQKQLKVWGERKLSEMCKPTTKINAEIVDRRNTPGFEYEVFDINDIGTIYYINNEGKKIREKQRIIQWEYDVFAPYNSTIVLGDKRKDIIDIIKQAFDAGDKSDSNINSSGNISFGNIYDRDKGKYLPTIIKDQEIYIELVKENLSNLIEITAEKIRAELTDTANGLKHEIEITADRLTSEIIDTQNNLTSLIEQTASSIRLEVQSVAGDVASLSLEVDNNGRAIVNIKSDITNIESDIVNIEGDISAINADFRSLSTTVASIERAYVSKAEIDDLIAHWVSSNIINTNTLNASNVNATSIQVSTIVFKNSVLKQKSVRIPKEGSVRINGETYEVSLHSGTTYDLIGY